MKYSGRIFWSLFLASIFGAGTIVRAKDFNLSLEFVQNGMKFLSTIVNETDKQRSRFSLQESAVNDGTLQPEAISLALRVRKADDTLQELFETYANLILTVGWTCDYTKAAYKDLTKLDINGPMEAKISHLNDVVNTTSQFTEESQELIDRAYGKIINISANLVFMQEDLGSLGRVNKTQVTEKFIEDTKVYNEWLERACSEFGTALRDDQKFISAVKGIAESQETVVDLIEKISPEDPLIQTKLAHLSESIVSSLRGISDVCVEAKSG